MRGKERPKRRGAKPAKAKVVAKRPARVPDLEKRLAESLDQQIATSDILRVISRSQTDVQPVFDAILASAVRLLGAHSGALIRLAGDQIELAALTSTDAAGNAAARAAYPQSLHSEGLHAQAIRDRAPFNITDAHTDPRLGEAGRATARARGFRSGLGVPLLRHDEAVGAIGVTRREPGGFTDDEIALLKTFADQAVIAIENVRLFTELEARNHDLTEALEQQTVTSEILRVMSSSPTDVQPVLDAVAESAARLCGATDALINRVEGNMFRLVAHHGTFSSLPANEELRPVTRDTASGRAILERRTIHVDDMVEELARGNYPAARLLQEISGFRTILAVPLIHDDVAGRDRHRERTVVYGAWGAEPRPDSDERHPPGDLRFADRCPAGLRGHRPEREASVRR